VTFHLAQVNIGRVRGPMDSEIMYGFASRLAEINALADNAPGFVWRLQSDSGDATSIHVYDDEMLLINMSVWENVEALFEYTYRSDHVQLLRGRAEWFERLESHHMAMWWIPAGHIPTPQEAKARLEHLDAHGPTPYAFTFKQRFAAEAAAAGAD
jgi:hypothetical protein